MSQTTNNTIKPAIVAIGAPNSVGAPTTHTDQAVALAKDGAQMVASFETVNPALYAQLVGSLATYGKSAAAPLVGSALGALVAHYGLGPFVTADTLTLLTEVLVAIGTSAGALVMHWFGKAPGRALAAGVAVTPGSGT